MRADVSRIPPDFDCTPSFSLSEAQKVLSRHLSGAVIDEMAYERTGTASSDHLCIYDGGGDMTPRLAWRIYVILDGEEQEAVVDAADGTVLHLRVSEFPVREQSLELIATDLLGDRRRIAVTKGNDDIYRLEDRERKIFVYDAGDKAFELPGQIITAFRRNDWSKTAVSAMANIRSAYDYYQNCLGRHFDRRWNMRAAVNTDIRNNAYWSDNKSMILFGEGDSEGRFWPRSLAAGEDITAHECTHSIIAQETALGYAYYGACGAINEGYADIFGCLVQGDWKIGEDVVKEKCLRDIAVPFHTGNPSSVGGAYYIDYKTDSTDYGGVHRNSTILSHLAYVMHQNGLTKRTLYELWYKSLCLGYGKYSDFYDVRINVLTAARALKYSDAQIQIICDAFEKANIRKENCQEQDSSYFRWLTCWMEAEESILPSDPPLMEIVLEWKTEAADLDLSVSVTARDGSIAAISYSEPEYAADGTILACLVEDRTKGPARECIRIWDANLHIVGCQVSLYGAEWESIGWDAEDVTVSVFENGIRRKTFSIPADTGPVWDIPLD